MRKKGIFFSTDALVALMIIFITIIIFSSFITNTRQESQNSGDLIEVLSNLKINEIDNSYANSLILGGLIKNLNNTLVEQIGEFYIENQTLAKNLAQSILNDLEPNENIGIWYDEDLIAYYNKTPIENSSNIDVERIIISGLKKGESVTGFSSRAYLENSLKIKYFYFGGYIGDGNISARIGYDGEIKDIKLEITSNEDFDIYINGNFSGHYQNSSSNKNPAIYDLSAYSDNFFSGENIIKLVGDNQKLHIAGGYIRISFENSSMIETEEERKYYFPGIEGLINIYDGFYVPNELEEMSISLHYESEHDIFLNIGNTTLYNGSSKNETTINITNQELLEKLDYNSLVNKTIPLRLGMYNVSYIKNITLDADVISVTDLSGSMCGTCSGGGGWCCLFSGGCNNRQPSCEYCGGICEDMIYDAKQANKDFITDVLNRTGNRVGLVGYASQDNEVYCHDLSENNESLKNKVDEWEAVGGTCICCGVNRAVQEIVEKSGSQKYKSIVVMSDGEANVECSEQGTGSASGDAIQAACDAYQQHEIVVHTVGFGDNVEEQTLIDMANCGEGNYYFSDFENLTRIYQEIAQDILDASYDEQTIEATEDISIKLFPDSYIDFKYISSEQPYGLALTSEEKFYNSYEGNFSIPNNSIVLDAKAISYSGSRWTSNVKINNKEIYKLSIYGSDFVDLGDPYVIDIPVQEIEEENTVRIATGLSPANETEGSENNKIIYRIIKNFVSYSPITSKSEGCVWEIDFEEGETKIINVPEDYDGENRCYYKEEEIYYDGNDATQIAVYELLREADFDENGKVDVNFLEDNLMISSSEIIGIPYSWSTEVQIRRWY